MDQLAAAVPWRHSLTPLQQYINNQRSALTFGIFTDENNRMAYLDLNIVNAQYNINIDIYR
jgi:hypothetical protein